MPVTRLVGDARSRARTGNGILDKLPRRQRSRLLSGMDEVTLPVKAVVLEPGEPIAHVLFPVSGVISEMAVAERDTSVEVATVGNEGVVGLRVFLGSGHSTTRAVCTIATRALRMEATAFRDVTDESAELRGLLRRYTGAFVSQVSRNVVCYRHHTNDERMARWLLTSHDRVGADTLPVTQEHLSDMLGVRRSTVSFSASALKRAGLIRYGRGMIAITDRAGLEAAACSCYTVIRAEMAWLKV